MKRTATSRDALMDILKKEFPKMWTKEGEQFSSGYINTIWTGEGSYDNEGHNLFNYGTDNSLYTMGISKKLERLLDEHGWYCEWYDSGTVFIFVG